jgi:hypothetical protein
MGKEEKPGPEQSAARSCIVPRDSNGAGMNNAAMGKAGPEILNLYTYQRSYNRDLHALSTI